MTHLVQHALFLCVFPFAWAGVPDMLGGVAGDGARQRRLSGFTEKKSTAEESERPLWDAETQVTYAATVSRLEAQLEEDKESIFARSQAHPDSELEFLPMPARWHVHEYNPRIRCWEDQDVEVPQPLKPLAEDRVTDLREVKAAAKLWCTLQGMLRRACELDAVKGQRTRGGLYFQELSACNCEPDPQRIHAIDRLTTLLLLQVRPKTVISGLQAVDKCLRRSLEPIRRQSKARGGAVGGLSWTVHEEPHYRTTREFLAQVDKKHSLQLFLYLYFIKHRQHLYHVLLNTSWMELLAREEVWNSPDLLLPASSESNSDAESVTRIRKETAQFYVASYLTALQRYIDSVHVLSELFEADWNAKSQHPWRRCGSLLCAVALISEEGYGPEDMTYGRFWQSYPVRKAPRNELLLSQRIERMVAFLGGEEKWAPVRRNWEEGTAIGATYD